MKRFFPLLLGLFLIIISTNTAYCHVPIKICDFRHLPSSSQSQCNPTAAELTNIGGCQGVVKAFVRVANLATNPIFGNTYSLPSNVPDMYYEYTVDGVVNTIGPINQFVYNFNHKDQNGNNQPIYEFESDMIFDLTGECKAPMATNIFFDVRIVDDAGILYNLDNHGSTSGIFTCLVFEETCNFCHPTCQGSELQYPGLLACGEPCQGCAPPNKLVRQPDNSLTGSASQEALTIVNEIIEKEIIENQLQEVTISPNPFSDRLEISLPSNLEAESVIEIIDSKGSVVLKKNVEAKSENSINLDMNDLSNGLYYCRILAGKEVITKKIVKI